MALLFVLVQVIAIIIAPIYSSTQTEAMGGRETIENPLFSLCYLAVILVFTFIILYIAKKKKEKFIKYLILAAIFMTMIYLFVPLTMEALSSDDDDGWYENELGFSVEVIIVEDVDDDGDLEVVAGCGDNRIRVYESLNDTLEWESGVLNGNITKILIGNYDSDDSLEIVAFTGSIMIFDGQLKSLEYTVPASNIPAVTGTDLNNNNITELIFASSLIPSITIMESETTTDIIDISSDLSSIDFLDTTDDGRIVVADNATVVLVNPTTHEIDLKITELDNIDALEVYNDPNGEDLIFVASNKRLYLYGLSSEEYLRKSSKLSNIKAIYFERYDIPKYSDILPDILAVSNRTVYIIPDLIKPEALPWFLRSSDDIHGFYSRDLDGDNTPEMILGHEDSYRYTPIVFREGSIPFIPLIISILAALALTVLVHIYPEWYVVDTVGLVMAIGAVVILGVTFAILPAVVLLIVLAIYDAISVYKTKHMITLADSVIDLNLPVLLVIPKKLSYSYRKEKPRLKEQIKEGKEREAMFMGLGDIVIPSLLIISAIWFLPAISTGVGITGNVIVGIGTMIGILVGFSVLMTYVLKGNPQAGLPLLNSGALLGYAITYMLIYNNLSFGFNLNFF
jgi:presenilin-like A22 family membrane protease